MNLISRLLTAALCLCICTPAVAQDGSQAAPGQAGADEVARNIVQASGDPTALEELAFSFIVEKDGQEVMRRRHIWQPQKGALTVTSGDETIALSGLHDHDLSKLARDPKANANIWEKIAPNSTPAQAAKAWGWFVNDSYWLLAPAKLMDPGVNRALDEQGRLVLTFGEVGLTPGDRYELTFEKDTWLVSRWDFELESGRKGGFAWEDYEKAGPLMVSTRRVSDEGDVVIRLEDVEAKK